MPLMPLLGANFSRAGFGKHHYPKCSRNLALPLEGNYQGSDRAELKAAVLSHERHRWGRIPITTDNTMISEGINEIPGGLPVGLTGGWIKIYVPRRATSGFPAQIPTETVTPETRRYWCNRHEQKPKPPRWS
jgi:hypothetical protein